MSCPNVNHRSIWTRGLDFFVPRNSVTGSREIRVIPRVMEQFFELVGGVPYGGEHVPLDTETLKIEKNREKTPTRIDNAVLQIMERLTGQFSQGRISSYTSIIAKEGKNAASFGGKIFITKDFLQEIYNKVPNEETIIAFRSTLEKHGVSSTFTDQLEGKLNCTEEDLVAATLAHEVVHSEARDLLRRLESRFVLYVMSTISSFCAVTYLWKNHFKKDLLESVTGALFATLDLPKFSIKMIQKVLNSLSKGKIEKAAERFRFALLVLLIPAFIAFLGFLTAQYFSRQQEYRADLHSMALLQKAGYNPVAMIWECFVLSQTTPNTHSLADRIVTSISDHPLSEDRMVECLRNLPDIETKKITIYGSERTKTQD